ncbi:MAG TPA: AarF/ABC1/UbiB kinase family protein [Methanobacteriaceae archaeon]|nr:AarF/ABC1/UbiB kinase family protein [Methanobacteriaceae archaeon]
MASAYQSNLKRLHVIIRILYKYEFGYIIEKIKLKHKIPFIRRSYKYESLEELDESTPERIRFVLQELGPTFIKLGQTLSTRPDLVGERMALEFTKLQEDNPPLEFDVIKTTLEEELGSALETIFESFDPEPLGSASIGQVHRAVLKSGEEVAVKIQKPGVEGIIKNDIAIMLFLARRINSYIPKLRIYNLPGIVEEFERSILKEIDYQNEAMNLKRFRQNFQMDHTVYVPQIYSQHSTPKVITMELIQGRKVSEVTEADGYHLKLIAKRGALSYFKQVVEDGFFHADPHPSNIYILKGDVLCYLDFGMMGVLDEDFRQDLAELFIYLMDTNVKGTISKLQQMGIIDEHVDTRSLKYDLIDLLFKYYGTELSEVHGGLDDLLRLMRKYQATLPRELVLLARGIGMVEEMGRKLDPTFNAVEIAQPLVRKIARKRLSPLNFLDYLKKNIFEMEHTMKNMPTSITRTLYRLEKGDMQIKVVHSGLERSTNKLSISLVLAALLIGSSLIMTTDNGIFLLKFPYLGVAGFIISAILASGLVLSILRDQGI